MLKIKNRIVKSYYIYGIILIFSFLLILISEIAYRANIKHTIEWMAVNPLHFLSNVLLIYSIMLLLTGLSNNYKIGIFTTGSLYLFISLINCIKYYLRGIPLIAMDFTLNSEALDIANVVLTQRTLRLIIVFIVLEVLLLIAIKRLAPSTMKSRVRGLVLLVSLIFCTGIFVYSHKMNQEIRKDIKVNGFLINFATSFKTNQIATNLNGDGIENIDEFKSPEGIPVFQTKLNHELDSKQRPNIIVIMSEAFWNPELLKGIEFNRSPYEYFEKLSQESKFGYLEVPVYGGGTSNTEFEILTGNIADFYDDGYMIYPNEIHGPTMSMASILRKQGYHTVGIHPYHGWYWNRREVYKHLGFHEFLSEEYMINPKYKGFYIGDEYVTDLIIDRLESTHEPLFAFAVTMQNHGPYEDDRYMYNTRDIYAQGDIDDKGLQIIQTYGQGVFDAGLALEKLINYLQTKEEPTVVLFFGDHLPMLGENYKVYRDTNFIQGDSGKEENHYALHTVPFFLWHNYGGAGQDLGNLNASFIGPILLNDLGLEIPNYYKHLIELTSDIRVINKKYITDTNDNYIKNTNVKYKEIYERYRLLQGDIMYGDRIIEEDKDKWTVEKNYQYNSKINNISIDNIELDHNQLLVKGKNFYPKASLYINNKEVDFTFMNQGKISLAINPKKISSGSVFVVKLYDSEGNLLTESNSFTWQW